LRNEVLQDHDGDTASETTSDCSKTHEQDNASLPGSTITTTVAILRETGLVDRVDDEHAEDTEDDGNPVDKGHMYVGAIEGRFRIDGGIKEDEEGDSKL
jgi:hypothetical protein